MVLPNVISNNFDDYYIGDDAQQKRDIFSINYPINHGIVTNWDDLEKIWDFTFKRKLNVCLEDHPVLLSEAPLNPVENREKMAEIMFESFKTPAMYVEMSSVLSLYASGRVTGTVVEVGDGVTCAVPIYEGFGIPEGVKRLDLGGRDITNYLGNMLKKQKQIDMETVKDIKEKLCFVSQDFNGDILTASSGSSLDRSYTLPDGQVLTLNEERFRCPEALFKPLQIGVSGAGVDQLTFTAINSCEIDVRKDLYANIVLSGGSTCFDGFTDRMLKGINKLAQTNRKVKMISTPERKYSVWIGGSILSSLTSLESKWINKQDYEENGPRIIHSKNKKEISTITSKANKSCKENSKTKKATNDVVKASPSAFLQKVSLIAYFNKFCNQITNFRL